MSILFISHDLAIVKKMADEIYVMKSGKIVEHGEKDKIFFRPTHSYTKELIGFQNKIKQHVSTKYKNVIEVENLKVWYPIKKGLLKKTVDYVKAINNLSFTLKEKETFLKWIFYSVFSNRRMPHLLIKLL